MLHKVLFPREKAVWFICKSALGRFSNWCSIETESTSVVVRHTLRGCSQQSPIVNSASWSSNHLWIHRTDYIRADHHREGHLTDQFEAPSKQLHLSRTAAVSERAQLVQALEPWSNKTSLAGHGQTRSHNGVPQSGYNHLWASEQICKWRTAQSVVSAMAVIEEATLQTRPNEQFIINYWCPQKLAARSHSDFAENLSSE